MRHTCEHCETHYEIPDTKVEGRRVKVRCVNCDGIMFVVGPGAETLDVSASGRLYYFAWQGQPVGPLSAHAMIEQVRAGRVDARSLVWSPGFSGWRRVIESASLRWLYDEVVCVQLAGELPADAQSPDVFDRAGFMSDGAGYFPDPTLKSGVILLDGRAQRQLQTLAQVRGLCSPAPSARGWLPAMALAASVAMGLSLGAAAYLGGWMHNLPHLASLMGI